MQQAAPVSVGSSEDWVVLDTGKSYAWSAQQTGTLQQQADALERLIQQQGQQVCYTRTLSCSASPCHTGDTVTFWHVLFNRECNGFTCYCMAHWHVAYVGRQQSSRGACPCCSRHGISQTLASRSRGGTESFSGSPV